VDVPEAVRNPLPVAGRLLGGRGTVIQAKLAVGAANDPLERDADAMARHVVDVLRRREIKGANESSDRLTGG
jgi:hypothetical protein